MIQTKTSQQQELNNTPTKQEIDSWFVSFIDDMKADHFMLETNSASVEKKDLYTALIRNDSQQIVRQLRTFSTQHYITSIVVDYLNELKSNNKNPLKLAFGISDSKILVWSEIEDNDDIMEDVLLICEAKINGKYSEQGFYINSTIIERSDNIPVPSHYKPIIA